MIRRQSVKFLGACLPDIPELPWAPQDVDDGQ